MCELLPHIFTLTCRKFDIGGNFLWHFLFPQQRDLPVKKYGALCCPDFPLRFPSNRSDRTGDGWLDKTYGLGPVGFPKRLLPVAKIAVSL